MRGNFPKKAKNKELSLKLSSFCINKVILKYEYKHQCH